MKKLILLSAVFIFSFASAQQKHALIIAIGDYPMVEGRANNWPDLSSVNDVTLVSKMLKEQQFNSENIKLLKDQDATVPNIEKAFEELIKNAQMGDIIYIHYSGHGQQVPDLESGNNKHFHADEHDGWDEALVTYHAPVKFEEEQGYNYEHHFVDDQFNYYVNRLREKIGKTGQIIIILDSCHSGTGTRGADGQGIVRGTGIPCAPKGYKPRISGDLSRNEHTENDFDYSSNTNLGVLTVFSGCKANQSNYEYVDRKTGTPYGSLSYFLVKSMTQLGENASYRNLFDKINERMAIEFSNKQQPVFEGDELDQLIFKGTFVKQEPYFKVEKLSNNSDMAKIGGGSLHGLQEGDSIGFYFHTVADPKGVKPEYKGVITKASIISADVKLDQVFIGVNNEYVKFRAFLTKSKSEPMSVSVKLDLDNNKKLKKELTNRLDNLQSIQLTDENYTYVIRDTLLDPAKKEIGVVIYLAHNGLPLRKMTPRQLVTEEDHQDLINILLLSVRAKFFREIMSSDNNIDTEIKMNSPSVLFKNNDRIDFDIRNNGPQPIYVYIIDILPNEEMSVSKAYPIYPGKIQNLNFPLSCGNGINPKGEPLDPCGKEQLKIISSIEELNLGPLVKMGESLQTRGDGNPFAEFMNDVIEGTRGLGDSEISVDVQNIFFEISE